MKKISNTKQAIKKLQSSSSIQKIRRDKAKNALIETKVSLEIASREISKFIDEFQIAKSDEEKVSRIALWIQIVIT